MYTKRKLWVRALSVFLSALIVVQILPLTVWANELQDPIVSETVEESTVDYGELAISEEVVEKRDAYSKTYLLEDGTYCTITSSTAIHTEENGEWEEITPLAETPETANEASTLISAQAEENSEENANSTEDTEVGDGLIVQSGEPLKIYGAEYVGGDGSGSEWKLTTDSGYINPFSFVLVKPNLMYLSNEQHKAEVTVNATIQMTCNTQEGNPDYKIYTQLLTGTWDTAVPDLDELLVLNDNGDIANVSSQIYDYNTITQGGNFTWDVTSVYCQWENGTLENNGLIFRPISEYSVRVNACNLLRFYRVIDNNDNGFTYHSEDMGRAGTLYINDYTNTPLLERAELSITGNKMPVSLSRFISYELEGASFGASGRWNYSSDLTYSHDTFIWNTFDGSSKRFQRSSDDETDAEGREKWVEYLYNGGGCVLWAPANIQSQVPYDFSNCIIIDEEDNVYRFNSSNKLISITNGNTSLNISYTGSNISSITDGAGRVYEFDNSGSTNDLNCVKSVSLKDSSGNQITYDGTTPLDIEYTYVEKSNKLWLASATYADGKTVNYEYDNYGRLTVIKNIDNSKLEIEYYNENPLVSNNPTYASRIKSYTKSIYDTENETYVNVCTVEFDSDDTYRRTVTTTQGSKVLTEISQYGTNLDVLYATDSDGNEYYADYDDSHKLKSLVTGTPESEAQLVTNGEMEDVVFGSLVGWNLRNMYKSDYSLPEREADNQYVQFVSSISQEREFYQNINIDGKAGDKYVISAWGLAESLIPNDTRFWGIKIDALREDGTYVTIHEMPFDTSLWGVEQTRKTAFALDFDTTRLQIRLASHNQENVVGFDNIELYKAEDAYVASVDDSVENGCICSNCTEPDCPCTCTDESTCNCIPCKRGITTVIDNNGNEVTTTTDGVYSMVSTNAFSPSGNYLISSTDENGVTTYYSYNEDNGTLTSMANGDADNTINYTYNAVGLLKTVSQTVTNIMTGEEVNMVSSYTYDGDNLTQINHNGSVYSFEYDLYGNVSNVKISDQSLATYSYTEPDRLGYLLYGNGDRINYTYDANGNVTSVSTQKDGEEPDALIEYTYTYDADGTLLSYTDNVNGTVTNYTDNGYSIVIPATDDSSEDTVIYSTAYNEDTSEDTVTLFGYTFNTKDMADTYDVQTGQTTATTKYTLPCEPYGVTMDGEALTVTDYFGRNISTTYNLSTDNTFENADVDISKYDHYVNNTYTYVTDDNNKTSNLVSSVTSTIKLVYNATQEEIDAALESGLTEDKLTETLLEPISLSATTSYEYDDAGRIQKIYRNSIPISVYKYDEAGQLTEEINYTGEDFSAIRYTYDAGGNISSKVYYDSVSYDETSNTFSYGAVTKTVNYTYGNSESYPYDNIEWDDRLTNYDGMDIKYDELGNPLNYKGVDYAGNTVNATLEWNGRLLTSFTYTDDTENGTSHRFEYYYNADGLRTKKIHKVWDDDIDGYQEYEYIEYVWEGNLLKGYRISFPAIIDKTTGEISQGIVLPLYDDNSEVIGVAYQRLPVTDEENNNNPTYHSVFFIKDAQGNIISAYDPLTDIKVNYSYDAYGQTTYFLEGSPISEAEDIINNGGNTGSGIFDVIQIIAASASLAFFKLIYKDICMFAYRGYMYDGESGLYYNQSRYYSPEWGRFLNADIVDTLELTEGDITGANLFTYCNNDPVNKIDAYGYLGKHWYNKVSNVAKVINIAILVISGAKSAIGIKALRAFIKANRKKLIKTVEKELLKLIGTTAKAIVPNAINIALELMGTSIGELIAKGLDYVDPIWKKGYKRSNGYILN